MKASLRKAGPMDIMVWIPIKRSVELFIIHIGLKSLWEVDVVKGVSKKVKLVIVSTYILVYDI